jgi:hypothetical protein
MYSKECAEGSVFEMFNFVFLLDFGRSMLCLGYLWERNRVSFSNDLLCDQGLLVEQFDLIVQETGTVVLFCLITS